MDKPTVCAMCALTFCGDPVNRRSCLSVYELHCLRMVQNSNISPIKFGDYMECYEFEFRLKNLSFFFCDCREKPIAIEYKYM